MGSKKTNLKKKKTKNLLVLKNNQIFVLHIHYVVIVLSVTTSHNIQHHK